MYYIYKITSPSNKSYIGKSKNPKERFHQHSKDDRYNIGKAIRKYGGKNMRLTVLFEIEDEEESYRKEQEVIEGLNTIAPNGYNLASGGEGARSGRKGARKFSKITILARMILDYQNNPSSENMEIIVSQLNPFLTKIVKNIHNKLIPWTLVEDLYQSSIVGLIEAIHSLDTKQENKHILNWIFLQVRNEILTTYPPCTRHVPSLSESYRDSKAWGIPSQKLTKSFRAGNIKILSDPNILTFFCTFHLDIGKKIV